MAFCARFPDKAYYFSFKHANQANSGISRKYANAGKLQGRPAPYSCNSMGVEHWHIGRKQMAPCRPGLGGVMGT
jgi:hypothetical protein